MRKEKMGRHGECSGDQEDSQEALRTRSDPSTMGLGLCGSRSPLSPRFSLGSSLGKSPRARFPRL